VYVFVDAAYIPIKDMALVTLSLRLFFFLTHQSDLFVADPELMLKDLSNLFELLPVVNAVELEGGEVDAGVVEDCDSASGLLGAHWQN
jgi:hypothetical protein